MNSNQDIQTVDDQQLVSSITYLASLASESQKIDPKLDILRGVTAQWDGQSQLDTESRLSLQHLNDDLKQYLINEDPIRSFTAESLELRMSERLYEKAAERHYFIPLTIGVIIFSAIVSLLLPLNSAQKTLVGVTIAMQLFDLIALWLFLSSLRNFKQEFRQVAYYLSLGIAFINLGILEYPIFAILQKVDSPLFRYGGWPEGATLGLLVIYAGLSKYSNALKVPTKSNTRMLVIAHAIMLPILGVLAGLRGVEHPIVLWLTCCAIGSLSITGFFGARMVSKFLSLVTSAYAKSLKVFYAYLLTVVPAGFVFDGGLLWLGHFSIEALSVILSAAAVPTLVILMYSGYSFKQETGK